MGDRNLRIYNIDLDRYKTLSIIFRDGTSRKIMVKWLSEKCLNSKYDKQQHYLNNDLLYIDR